MGTISLLHGRNILDAPGRNKPDVAGNATEEVTSVYGEKAD